MRCFGMWVGAATLLLFAAAVQCQDFSECYTDGGINFQVLNYNYDGLLTTYEGPLEICVNGQYESVCDIGWDQVDAQTLCESVIYGRVEVEPLYGLGEPSRRYASRTYNCSEFDYSLRSCNYTSDIDPECNSGSHVAGVRCKELCNDDSVQLRNQTYDYNNGLSTYQGRVDICVNGTYLPVCDIGFDNTDAQVVCSRIYGSNYVGEVSQSFHRFPSSEYFAQNLMCNGSEYSITQCPYSPPSQECNVGNHSAAVVCRQVCIEGDVYLANQTYPFNNGMNAVSGTVQVCIDKQYRYICADGWDNREADVVCRSLYYNYRAPYYENTASATAAITGGDQIYHNSMCNGTESYFSECKLPVSDSSSTCFSIGTVNCTEVITQCYSDGRFRLVNDIMDISPDETRTIRGRIEVCSNRSYSSLCSQYWDKDDAQVFCEYYARYQYGITNARITGYPTPPSQYGYSRAGVVPYDVQCNGTESRVEECDIDKSPESSSDICRDPASSAAGVVCSIPRPPCPEFDLRFTNSTYDYSGTFPVYTVISGNLEICLNGTYVAICDVGWDDEDAQNACNNFGYNEPFYRGEAVSGYTATTPIGVDDVMCPQNVTGVSQCIGNIPPRSPRCRSNFSAAGLRCIQERISCGTEGEIIGLNITYENYLGSVTGHGQLGLTAQLAVCHNGVYSSICDVGWDQENADVYCRSDNLGIGNISVGEPLYGFDSGIDPIVLENVNCSGTESDLSSCSRSSLGSIVNPVCRESNRAAGVRCKQRAGTCINDTVRLVDGPGFYEGRLEVCESHQWRTVCEEGFNAAAADSVCNHRLLLQGNATVVTGNAYGSGSSGPMLIVCPPDSYYVEFAPIDTCESPPPDTALCSHERDVGVRCSKGQMDILATTIGSNRLGSSSFALQCFAQQFPWNTTLESAGWYDNSSNPITESSKGGPVTIGVLRNMYDPRIVNLTYTFRSQLNFDHPLTVNDGGLYTCNVSVKLHYPDNSTTVLQNSTKVSLIVDVPPPSIVLTSSDETFNNRPYNATCVVIFEAAVPLKAVFIRWLNGDYIDLNKTGDVRLRISEIRQISNNTFARDVLVNPLKTEDSGTYFCEAGVNSSYTTGQSSSAAVYIDVLSPPSPPVGVEGLCSVVVWYSPNVSCDLIRGYDVRLYIPQSPHQNVTRRVGSNRTFYIIKDEDKLTGSHEETYVEVRVIHSIGPGVWSKGISLGCGEKPTPTQPTPRVYFELNGKVYLNNSALSMTDIGEGENALFCKTDKAECCGSSNRAGEFYYPNGVQVPIKRFQQTFYRNRGEQHIRLNRREEGDPITGTYRCEIPNADDVPVKIYIKLE